MPLIPHALGHSARYATLLILQVAMALALAALLFVVAERHNRRFDLTPTQSFVLSDEARRVAEAIQVPIRITAFYNSQEHGQRRQAEDLLQLFHDASPQISYRLLDLDRSPALAKKYGIASFNTGVIEADGALRPLTSLDEQEIANGLLKLTRHEERILCFFTGHGEHSPTDAGERTGYSEVAKALEKENFQIRIFDVVPAAGVPADCTVAIFAGPSTNFLPGEADLLARYLDAGGGVLVMADTNSPPSVVQFLAGYAVRVGDDIIVDERNRFFGADSFMPRVPIFDEGTFRKNLDSAAVFALARTVTPIDDQEGSKRVLLIALTSPDSWAHVDGGVVPEGAVQFRREMDKPGPLPVGLMVTRPAPASATPGAEDAAARTGRMVVFGDADFASNLYLNLLGNKDLFMSTIGVLSEDEQLIAMRRKGLPSSSLSPVALTAEQGRLIFWIAVVVEPAGFAALGLVITWRRRRRAGA
jgi:gliding motility-associatede transport system auxiliary component